VERKKYLLHLFAKHKIEIEWIEDFLPDSKEVLSTKKVYSKYAANTTGILNNAEISLLLKHSLAIKKIQDIEDYAIIFEDDIQDFDFDFNNTIAKFIELVEKYNIDILWIGSSINHNMDLPPSNEPTILSDSSTKSRLTHCYMINSKVADKVYNDYIDFKHPSDWQWNYIIDKLNLKSAWSYPHIYQRTDTKEIPSLLR
jgi:GR25 family glycosyltransferase involved in LPS biosynthesis